MKKSLIVASALLIGMTGPAFAAGDETGGGIKDSDPGARTVTSSSTTSTPETTNREISLFEYFLQLFDEQED